MILVILLALSPTSVIAQASDELISIYRGTPFYDPNSISCKDASSVTYTEEERYLHTWNFLNKEKHLPSNAVAGIMGNLHIESKINPYYLQGDASNSEEAEMPTQLNSAGQKEPLDSIYDKRGYGIVRWTTASRQLSFLYHSLGGGEAPFDIARSTGDLGYQLDYMWYELESSTYDDVLAVLEDPSVSMSDASDYFAINYLAPKSIRGTPAPEPPNPLETPEEMVDRLELNSRTRQQSLATRRSASEDMLRLYESSTYAPPSTTCQQDTAATGVLGGDGKVDSLTGYAFPLAPQTRAIGGIRLNQIYSIHGGTGPAFDLFGINGRKGGDDVYAFDDGVIAGIGEYDPGWCYSIQLKAADGFYYWYGHLNNLVVKRGDRVRSGQVMGEVAEWTRERNCRGTSGAAHLHIDRGYSINGVPQTGGRDCCRDPDFIPLLSEIYGRL